MTPLPGGLAFSNGHSFGLSLQDWGSEGLLHSLPPEGLLKLAVVFRYVRTVRVYRNNAALAVRQRRDRRQFLDVARIEEIVLAGLIQFRYRATQRVQVA